MTVSEKQRKIIFQVFGPEMAPNIINEELYNINREFVLENLKIEKIGDIFKDKTMEIGRFSVFKKKIFTPDGYKELVKLLKQKMTSDVYICYKYLRECDGIQVYCNSCLNWMHARCELFKDDGSGESKPYFCKRCKSEFKTYY